MPVQVVVFDAFGTLVQIGERLSPYRQLMRWMRDNGRRPQPDDAARIMSQPRGLASTAALFGMSPPIELLAAWEADLQVELRTVRVFPDAVPTIAQLRQAGYRVGLCSNLAAPYGEPVKALPALEVYAMSYDAGAVKPEPAIYQYLLDQLGCSPADVLFVGDTPSADLDGPLAFGMAARLIDRKAGQALDDVLADLLGVRR